MKLVYLLMLISIVGAAASAHERASDLSINDAVEQLSQRAPLRNFFRGSSSRSRRPAPALLPIRSSQRTSNSARISASSSENSGRWLARQPGLDTALERLELHSNYPSPGSSPSPPRYRNPNRSPSPPRHSVFSGNSLSDGSQSPPIFRGATSSESSAASSPRPSASTKAKGKGKATIGKLAKNLRKWM